MFSLIIDTQGDAFTENRGAEIARIMRAVADIIERQGPPERLTLRDGKGENCGEVKFAKAEAFRNDR